MYRYGPGWDVPRAYTPAAHALMNASVLLYNSTIYRLTYFVIVLDHLSILQVQSIVHVSNNSYTILQNCSKRN